jgi:hypothetical protein
MGRESPYPLLVTEKVEYVKPEAFKEHIVRVHSQQSPMLFHGKYTQRRVEYGANGYLPMAPCRVGTK